MRVLAFDRQKSRIVLFQQLQPGAAFRNRPLCPARDVRCLAMFSYEGSFFYLFCEQADPRSGKDPYRLSLLIPQEAGRSLRYRRQILQNGPLAYPAFRTVLSGDMLYVGFLQGSVRFLRLDLRDYLRSESD